MIPTIEIKIQFDPVSKQIGLFAPPIDKVVMLGLLEMVKHIVIQQSAPVDPGHLSNGNS